MEPTTGLLILLTVIGIICIAGVMLKYLNGDFVQYHTKNNYEFVDVVDKLEHVLTTHRLWSEEGTYTFPNGDTWHRG